jgi:hypothetical protein
MSESNPHKFDFSCGLVLVLALHIVFGILWFMIASLLITTIPFFQGNYNFLLLGFPLFFLGITQIAYLIPAYAYFANKQRHEVGKGIICSAVLTLFINSACFAQMAGGSFFYGEAVLWLLGGISLATAIGLLGRFLINRRMR